MAPVEDPWQLRLNRMRQLLPLPFLALSAAITFTVPASAFHRWARFELGLPLTAAAAVLWAVASVKLRGDPSSRWLLPVPAEPGPGPDPHHLRHRPGRAARGQREPEPCTSTPSSASAIAPRPWPPATSAAF
jgi:hypothetical protein